MSNTEEIRRMQQARNSQERVRMLPLNVYDELSFNARPQYGIEEAAAIQLANRERFTCDRCKMKFDTAKQLERHKSVFCDGRGNATEKEEMDSVTVDDLKGYLTAGLDGSDPKDVKPVGKMTLGQLKQAFNSSSLVEVQQRALNAEKIALTAKLRSYKLPEPGGNKGPVSAWRSTSPEETPGEAKPKPAQPAQAAPTVAGSITSLLAQGVLADGVPNFSMPSPPPKMSKDERGSKLGRDQSQSKFSDKLKNTLGGESEGSRKRKDKDKRRDRERGIRPYDKEAETQEASRKEKERQSPDVTPEKERPTPMSPANLRASVESVPPPAPEPASAAPQGFPGMPPGLHAGMQGMYNPYYPYAPYPAVPYGMPNPMYPTPYGMPAPAIPGMAPMPYGGLPTMPNPMVAPSLLGGTAGHDGFTDQSGLDGAAVFSNQVPSFQEHKSFDEILLQNPDLRSPRRGLDQVELPDANKHQTSLDESGEEIGVGIGDRSFESQEGSDIDVRGIHGLLKKSGRRVPEKIKSKDWYESVDDTEVNRRQAHKLMDEDQDTGPAHLIGMAVDHGFDMIALKQETERLELVKDLVKVQNQLEESRLERTRQKWLSEQREQVKEAEDLRRQVPAESNYDPVHGFHLQLDFLQSMPDNSESVQLVYSLYDGVSSLMPAQTTEPIPVVIEISEATNREPARRVNFNFTKFYKRLPPSGQIVLMAEVQAVKDEIATEALGWIVLPIFTADLDLLEGNWSCPLLHIPMLLDLGLEDFQDMPRIEDSMVYVRLYCNSPEIAGKLESPNGPALLEQMFNDQAMPKIWEYYLPPIFAIDTPRWIRVQRNIMDEHTLKIEKTEKPASPPPLERKKPKVEDQTLPKEAWCEWAGNEQDGSVPVAYDDVVVVMLDAAKFLPDNVTVAQATLSIIDEKGKIAFEGASLVDTADMDSAIHSPKFELSALFQVGDCIARSWVLVRIDTVDIHTNTPCCVGFACSPLFINPTTGRALTQVEEDAYYKDLDEYYSYVKSEVMEGGVFRKRSPKLLLRKDGVQLPLRASASLPPNPAEWQLDPTTIGKLPRLPCASVLLRFFVNPEEADHQKALDLAGVPALLNTMIETENELDSKEEHEEGEEPPQEEEGTGPLMKLVEKIARTKPKYNTGYYDSTGVIPTGVEKVTYMTRLSTTARDLCAKDVLRRLVDFDEFEYLRSEGDEAMREAISKLFSMAVKEIPAINLRYFCLYNPSIGFKVSVDGVNNIPTHKGEWPIVIFGVVPPCAYFGPEGLTLDTHFHSALDMDSTQRCPRWAETFVALQNVPFRGQGIGLVVQICTISRKQTKEGIKIAKKDIGWAAMPLFFDNEMPYLLDGGFQIPMYKGLVPRNFAKLIDAKGVEGAMQVAEKEQDVKLLPGASALVRVSDLQRGPSSHPIDAPNPTDTDPGIPSDCETTFIRQWVSTGEERIRKKDWPKYAKIDRGGFLFSAPRDKTIKELLPPDQSPGDFESLLRSDSTTITRIPPPEGFT